MAVKKPEYKEPSCPLWLATYGDLVTNMLVFFVLLLSMSEIKRDDKFIEFMQAVREAFGYIGGLQQLPLEQMLDVKNVPLAEMLIVPIRPQQLAEAPDPGIMGKQSKVTDIRPRDHVLDGGPLYFRELEAQLTPAAEAQVAGYAEKLRGHRTQIEVRGHCSLVPVAGTGFEDHYALAFARARAVADALVRNGVAPERIILVGAGAHEPVHTAAYTPAQRRENDRVEIFQLNKRVEDYGATPPASQPAP